MLSNWLPDTEHAFYELAESRLFTSTLAMVGHARNRAVFRNRRVNWVTALPLDVWYNLETGPKGALKRQCVEHSFSVR